jgi:predicted flap endonuclease-1-like 5' DNA nuclease
MTSYDILIKLLDNNYIFYMSSIETIQGIGEVYAEKLRAANIQTVNDLLERAKTPSDRAQLSEETGFAVATIRDWANMADLMRINGVGGQYAELLEKSGVDTVKELRTRNAENLAAKIEEINAEKNLTNRVPSITEVTEWISEANTLDPVIEY